MKKLLLIALLGITLFSCKKDKETEDASLKTITYTFAPNGTNAQIIYLSNQQGKTINAGFQSALFSVNDQVKPGDKIKLQMSTNSTITRSFEIRVTHNNKSIITKGGYETDGAGTKYIVLEKTLTASDFK